MRWWSIPIAAALVWFLFTLTPFWALYDLARAVEAGDTGYVERHVNVRALRISMTRQFTEAIRLGAAKDMPDRRGIGDAAAALALPLAEALITPRMVVDLLDDGWPQSLDATGSKAAPKHAEGLHIPDPSQLAAFYLASEMRGFATVVIAVPPQRPAAEQFKLRMRIRNWSWRLVDIRLNDAVRERIVNAVARAQTARGEKSDAGPDARIGSP